jgi:CRP-like cAMP-binding protein
MGAGRDGLTIAQSGQLDALVALVRIGMRLTFSRNDEICAEGGSLDCWYKVVSGTVRVCKLLEDGRRHIGEFCFSGDCFGIDSSGEQLYSAEAVDDVIVTRFQRNATERLIDQNPALARRCAMRCYAIWPTRTGAHCCTQPRRALS